MNKLGKKREEEFNYRKDECASEAARVREALAAFNAKREEVLEKANQALKEAWEPVDESVADYNLAVAEAAAFCQDVANDAEAYADDKSERWQESERGEAYREWAQTWESSASELNDLDLDQPEELEMDEVDDPVWPHEFMDDCQPEFSF